MVIEIRIKFAPEGSAEGVDWKRAQESFGGEEDVFYRDGGVGYTGINICHNS